METGIRMAAAAQRVVLIRRTSLALSNHPRVGYVKGLVGATWWPFVTPFWFLNRWGLMNCTTKLATTKIYF